MSNIYTVGVYMRVPVNSKDISRELVCTHACMHTSNSNVYVCTVYLNAKSAHMNKYMTRPNISI